MVSGISSSGETPPWGDNLAYYYGRLKQETQILKNDVDHSASLSKIGNDLDSIRYTLQDLNKSNLMMPVAQEKTIDDINTLMGNFSKYYDQAFIDNQRLLTTPLKDTSLRQSLTNQIASDMTSLKPIAECLSLFANNLP